MSNQQTKLNLIQQIAEHLGVSIDDVNAVVYGERPVDGAKLQSIIDNLADDGRGGVFVCAVWKGNPITNAVRNLPRYDYFGQIIEGLNLYLHKKGYTSQLLISSFPLADYAYFEDIILRHRDVGLVNVASHFTGNLQKACEDYQRPLVFLDYPAGEDTNNQYIISMKSEAVIAEVVKYLNQLGHRRIAFIQGPQEKQTALDRYRGYCAGLAEAGIELDEALVLRGNWETPSGKAATEQFLALPLPPTAIIASNDLMAFGVMQAIELQGLHIPKDISVVGFDDIAMASMTKPPLTSVRTPMTDMGSMAGEYIVKLLEGEAPHPQHIHLPLDFIKRESTGPAPTRTK
jgi:DNA-binding LacI/PurR family transcriptional regulator